MELNEFVAHFAEQFEETDASVFTPATKYHDLEEWSSLIGLSVIAMVDDEYDVRLLPFTIENESVFTWSMPTRLIRFSFIISKISFDGPAFIEYGGVDSSSFNIMLFNFSPAHHHFFALSVCYHYFIKFLCHFSLPLPFGFLSFDLTLLYHLLFILSTLFLFFGEDFYKSSPINSSQTPQP